MVLRVLHLFSAGVEISTGTPLRARLYSATARLHGTPFRVSADRR